MVATPRHLDCPFLSANKYQPSLRFFLSSLRYSNLVPFSLISQPLSRPGQGSRWSRGGGFLVLDIGDRKFRYPRKIPRTKARLDRTLDDDPVYPLPLCWFLREFYPSGFRLVFRLDAWLLNGRSFFFYGFGICSGHNKEEACSRKRAVCRSLSEKSLSECHSIKHVVYL